MNIEVISLGGSLIVPDKVDERFLRHFKRTISAFKDRTFVIVTGGGSTARDYMNALLRAGVDKKTCAAIGIRVCQLHAHLLTHYFRPLTPPTPPTTIAELARLLKKHRVIFTAIGHYHPHNTSDGIAAELARTLRTRFINMTNTNGLYDKNPQTHANANLITHISHADFYTRAMRIRFHLGQHFVLDQHAATIIKKYKIPTYIIGRDLRNLANLLKGKRFTGTTITSRSQRI